MNEAVEYDIKKIHLKHKSAELRSYFTKKQQLKEANLLKDYLHQTSAGISSMVGSDQLYRLAKDRSEKAEVLESEIKEYEDRHPDDFTKAKSATYKAVIITLQREVEATASSISHRNQAMKDLAESSKQKARLRSKNEKDAKRVEVLVDKLTQVQLVMDEAVEYDLTEIKAGKYPWKMKGSTDWTIKKQATDLYMLQQRLIEEEPLLKKEMKHYLQFHVDIKNNLKREIQRLQTEVEKFGSESSKSDISKADMQMEGERYSMQDGTKTLAAVKGLLSLKEEGLDEAINNINWALTCFKKVLTADGWKSMRLDTEDDVINEDEEEETEELLLGDF